VATHPPCNNSPNDKSTPGHGTGCRSRRTRSAPAEARRRRRRWRAFSSVSLQLCTGYGYVLSYAFSRFPAYHFNCVPAMDMYYPMLFAFSSISLQLCTGYECVLSYAFRVFQHITSIVYRLWICIILCFSRFPAYHFNCVPAMSVCYPMLFRVFQCITSIVFRL